LLSHPAPPGADHIRSLLLRCAQAFFFKLTLCRLKNRHAALRLPAIRRLRITATISSSVKSGCSAISASKTAARASSGEMLPPLGLAAMLPVSFKRCIHLIAELALTSTHSAASRRDAPASTSRSTRIRKSSEQGFGIDPLQKSNQCRYIPAFII
jgi:hypothetical protein